MSYYPMTPTDMEYADMELFEIDCDHNCDECWFDCEVEE